MVKKILIVDDEPLICSVLSRAICKFIDSPLEIITTERGEDALKKISEGFCDVCLLDINLPDLNGLDVMKKINEISPDTKIAIMTASCVDDDMKMTIEKGASLFLKKPVNLDKVKLFIKNILDGIAQFPEQALDFD